MENKTQSSIQELSEIKREEKPAKALRLETKVSELQKIKEVISQQTQTEFSTRDKSTQTYLTNQDYKELQKEIQRLKEENKELNLGVEKQVKKG